jgi:ribosomal protein S18 acetylase RimI-like enzyme
MAQERDRVVHWVSEHFDAAGWPAECSIAFARQPLACWIAVHNHRLLGFVCTEVAARGMLGPIGVDSAFRNQGIGRLLLLNALGDQRALGYAYSVIGQVGAADFFARAVGAQAIADSTPGPYASDTILV